jgi:YVTN family beta-propeller protein
VVTSVDQTAAFVTDMAFHPNGQYLYIARNNPNSIQVVDMDENGIDFGIVQAVYELPGADPTETPFSLAVARDGGSIDVLSHALLSGPATRSIYRFDLSNDGLSLGTPFRYALSNGNVGGDYLERLRVSPNALTGVTSSRADAIRLHYQSDPSNTINQLGVFDALTESEFEFTPDGSRLYYVSTFADSVRVFDFYGGTTSLYYLAVPSGNNQNGVVNQVLPAPIRATTIGEGLPLSGLVMTFRVVSGGGGLVTPDGVVDEINVATDDDGFADVEWQLGPDVGEQLVEVIAEGIDQSPRVVTANASADPNTLPLSIAEVLPLNTSSDVSATTAVLATFSRAVDPASIGSGSLFIEVVADATRVPVTFGFTDGDRKVSLTPSAPLKYSEGFRVVYSADIKDISGGSLSNPGSSSFTTQAAPPPTLHSVSPPSALVGVSIILNGAGFDPVPANNQVLFNNVVAVPTGGNTSRLDVVVPPGATTGTVAVSVGSATSNGKAFTVLQPNTSPIDEVVANVGTGTSGKSCAVTPDGALCYTVSPDGDVVVPVDVKGATAYASIAVGDQPVAIVIHPDGTFAYVANFNTGTVSVIDIQPVSPDFNKVVTTITVGVNPIDLAVMPDGDRVLVANAGAGDVSIIDGNESSASHHQVIANVGTGTGAKSLAVSADGARIFIGTDNGFVVMAASGYAVVANVGTGTGAKSLAVSPDGTLLFILATNGNILIVDVAPGSNSENEVIANVGAGTSAKSVAVSPDGSLLYVIQEGSDEVLVFSINVIPGVSATDPDAAAPSFRVETSLVKTVAVGADPSFVAVDPSGSGAVFVTNAGDKTLSILDHNLPPLEARFEFFPPILIVRFKNPYVTGWVQLPDGYAVRDIDVNSVRLNETVPAGKKVIYCDLNFDHVEDALYVFNKADLVASLEPGQLLQTVTINGNVGDRTFTGEDWLLALFPNVGQGSNQNVVFPGEPNRIWWQTPEGYDVEAADVHVSYDNGATWEPIATRVPNAGEVTWLPPKDAPHESGLIMVTLYQKGEVLIQGVSAEPFKVAMAGQATRLKSFDASMEDGTAVLRWETAVEAAMDGFQLVRSDAEDGTYAPVATQTIPSAGPTEGASYECRDASVRPNRTYWYKLQEVKEDGVGREFGPYALTYRLANRLEQNVPNPFNPTTSIKYSITEDADVRLAIYDVAGRHVRTLVEQRQRANVYRVVWDGVNDQGDRVASGVYFYKLVAGTFTSTRKMMLLK